MKDILRAAAGEMDRAFILVCDTETGEPLGAQVRETVHVSTAVVRDGGIASYGPRGLRLARALRRARCRWLNGVELRRAA